MAKEISIDTKEGQERGAGAIAAAWAIAAVDSLGRLLVWIFEGFQSVRGRGGERRQMRLVESLALGNRRQLLLVVCDDQRYLVGVGADSVGGILAVESPPVPGTGAQARVGLRSGPIGHRAKGPQLVRRGIHGIASDTKTVTGAGVWQ